MVLNKPIGSPRCGAVAGAVAAASAAAAAGPDDAEDAKPRGIEPAEGGGVPQWPGSPAAAAAGDPLNTRTYSTCSTVGAVAAAAGSATFPSHLVGAMHTVAAVACTSTLGKLIPGKSDMVHADENSPSSLRRPVIIL